MKKSIKFRPEFFEWTIHILFWMVFIIAPTALRERPSHPMPDNLHFVGHMPPAPMYNPMWTLMPFVILYFYLNYLVFAKWYRQRKYLKYALFNLFAIAAIVGVRTVLEFSLHMQVFHNLFFDSMLFLFMFMLSSSITIIKDKSITDKHLKESEISFLRNQINPHFLFNVMNMIVVFSRKYPEKVESAVNTLSDILRYVIYDTRHRSKAGHEIMVIEQYLSLQRLRFGEEVKINTSFSEIDPDLEMEPMLLMPIIENAFKHGTSMVDSPVIDISASSTGGTLYFEVKNKFSSQCISSLSTYSGLGLANIKRRLDLLYPQKYKLYEGPEDGGWFIVKLIIDCK